MRTITFIGSRNPNGFNPVTFLIENSNETDIFGDLPLFLNEVNHSPTGFEWGYGGSGPAQLAYAILRCFCENMLDMTKQDAKDWALANYQDFKWRVIAKITGDNWELNDIVVRNWLTKQAYKEIRS